MHAVNKWNYSLICACCYPRAARRPPSLCLACAPVSVALCVHPVGEQREEVRREEVRREEVRREEVRREEVRCSSGGVDGRARTFTKRLRSRSTLSVLGLTAEMAGTGQGVMSR